MEPLHALYTHYFNVLDVAFQPIVDIHSGAIFGVEALLRGTDTLGFETIHSFFDRLHEDSVLYTFEHRLKSLIYSPYGRTLIQNRSSNSSTLETYIEHIPIVDLMLPLETIVELFSLSQNAPGVLVIESSKYIGYLSAREMIEVIHERNLIRARDENPLTRLPGNFMINEYIAHTFETMCVNFMTLKTENVIVLLQKIAFGKKENSNCSAEQLNQLFALEKKHAKHAANHIAIINI